MAPSPGRVDGVGIGVPPSLPARMLAQPNWPALASSTGGAGTLSADLLAQSSPALGHPRAGSGTHSGRIRQCYLASETCRTRQPPQASGPRLLLSWLLSKTSIRRVRLNGPALEGT